MGETKDIPQDRTLNFLVNKSIEKFPESPALSFYDQEPITYRELGKRITDLSELLHNYGVRKGDKIAILGENSPAWGMSYLSILSLGAVAVPILPDFPAEDIEHILNHSESILLFATKRQADKLIQENCPGIKSIIILDDFSVENPGFNTIPFSEFLSNALNKISVLIHDLGEKAGILSAETRSSDLATIIYTSGTTGFSKGVMLTHGNIIANLEDMVKMIPFSENDRFLSILPLSHTIESTLGFLLPLTNGSSVFYPGKPPTPTILKKACARVRPTAIVSVPLIIEKIYKKRVKKIFEKNLLTRSLVKTPFIRRALYKKAVKSIMDFLGGELRVMAFGGAPLNSEVEHFLILGGFPYVTGYGLTETAPLLTGEPLGKARRGACGFHLDSVEIRIEDPDPVSGVGEILAKGPNVMQGYFKNRKLTEELLSPDGWFRTGDLGYLGKNDYLYIKGRSKSMFLGANGENIYPEVIEEKLNSLLCVQESLVVDNKGDIEALIHFDPDYIETKLEGKSLREQKEIISAVLEEIRTSVNQRLAGFSRIRKCFFQREPFQKTATQKIKRYLYSYGEQ